ncbi:MAG: YcjX family protein [Pseudomonadota bacterium]
MPDVVSQAGRLVTRAGDEAGRWTSDLAARVTGGHIRLGVTGLSRAGKTVFITALVHNLTQRGWLPFLEAAAEHRLLSAHIQPPAPHLDLFDFQSYFSDLSNDSDPCWPERTNSLSEIRLTLTVNPRSELAGLLGPRTIQLEIVDYPGEWLLDLPLLDMSYAVWSAQALELARRPERAQIAAPFLSFIADVDGAAPFDTALARRGADLFKRYLADCRTASHALSTLPPGRFLEPGDARNAPMLNFMPLPINPDDPAPSPGSIAAQMSQAFEAYKSKLVRPFFQDHFAKLDRQIVLVDLLRALNAGPAAVQDLERALAQILTCFRPGESSLLTRLVARGLSASCLPQPKPIICMRRAMTG